MKSRKRAYLRPDYIMYILLLVLLAERLYVFHELGADYMSYSDDHAYVDAGILFAKTGMISIWGPYPSAMIMPGMPVIIGLCSLLFGEGTELLIAVKLIWIVMGVLTAWVCYKTVSILGSEWGGVLAAAHFLLPNLAWMNHVLLTETPYMLFLALTVYYTFQMGISQDKKYFRGYLIAFMTGLMFRANILVVPLFTGIYLLIITKNYKLIAKRCLVLVGAILIFVVPWSIRNYIQFNAFIPVTYGTGNPMLLGTYEGEDFPLDSELDYKSNVYDVMHEKYASYYKEEPERWHVEKSSRSYVKRFDPDGEVKELKHAQFLSLEADGVSARYRMREWFRENPLSFLKSYLIIKPRAMLNWVWSWETVFGVSYDTLRTISRINCVFCMMTGLLAFFFKKYRAPILALGLLYVTSIYIYSTAFVTDRYASTLMLLRYMLAGFGVVQLADIFRNNIGKKYTIPQI